MLALVLASFVLGMSARRVAGPRESWVAILDRYVLRLALPAMILSKMSRASLGGDTIVPVLVAWSTVAASALVIVTAGRIARWERGTTGALLMVGTLGNTSFLGLGVVQGFLGRSSLDSAIAFDQLGTFLALATFGSFVSARFGSGRGGWRVVATRLVTFAPFIALVASPVVGALHPPDVVHRVLDVPGATVAPVAMLSLGWRFSMGNARGRGRIVAFGLGWKMIVMPACVLLVAVLLGSRAETAWATSVLQAGAPPMVTAGVVATAAGLDSAIVTLMVAAGTIAAAMTLPIWWLAVR